MQATPSRPPGEEAPAVAPADGGTRLPALLSMLALAALVTLAAAAVRAPELLRRPSGIAPQIAAEVAVPAEVAAPAEGPPLCVAQVRPGDEAVPDSGATAASLSVECDRPGRLAVLSSRGAPAGAELDGDGRFEGELGRHYLCAGAVARLDLAVVAAGGRWETTASLAASPGAPSCDVLIRPGVTELVWERGSLAVSDALAEEALGPPRGVAEGGGARALDHLAVMHEDGSGRWRGWGVGAPAGAPLDRLEEGERYLIAASAAIAWTFPDPPAPDAADAADAAPPALATAPEPPAAAASAGESVFERAQIVSYYGHPNVPAMGILGAGAPEAAAEGVAALAAAYDELNGERDVIPALHLITGVATSTPGPDGLHLRRLPGDRVRPWIRLAEERGQLIFLDVQVGWSDALEEVRALEEFLLEPHVHVALDPEFATRGLGRPGAAIGRIRADTVDQVQAYLAAMVREQGIPPKLLVLHQFLGWMLPGAASGYADHPEVEIVIDMDGYGSPPEKLVGYRLYALAAYSERPALKLFFLHDEPLMSPEEVQALDPPPALIIYQ